MDSAFKQDLAPKGGYPKIEYARNLPRRGPSGLVIMLGGVATMVFGFYMISRTNRQRRLLSQIWMCEVIMGWAWPGNY